MLTPSELVFVDTQSYFKPLLANVKSLLQFVSACKVMHGLSPHRSDLSTPGGLHFGIPSLEPDRLPVAVDSAIQLIFMRVLLSFEKPEISMGEVQLHLF